MKSILLVASRALSCAILSLVASLASAQPKSPTDMFGFTPGDDYKLASYEMQEAFYRQLAAASDRVVLREIGQSALGRSLYLLTISSPANLADLDRYREASEKLARARVSGEEAARLAEDAKAVVWIDAGLHATELAHGQMAPSLAWRVATEESAEMQRIRDDVIFLLMPGMNPDGLEIVRKWYESTVGTPFEATNPPELYHHYVGHDNNRDFFMNNMPESKAVASVVYREWYPQIVYNQHQISPAWARIVIPPYSDPLNPTVHPGVTSGLNEVGSAMGNRFAMEGMPGAIADVGFSMWWNGGMRTVPYFHNMIGILTETGHNWPSPAYYDPRLFPRMRELRNNPRAIGAPLDEDLAGVPEATVLYPYPWEGGESRFSEPVNFMITGSIAVLRAAADGRVKWLENIHRMGRDAIAAGQSGTRYWLIPAGQRHDDEAHNLVNILFEGGIEIERASEDFRAGDEKYEEGTFIVPAAQAFRPYIIDLLEKQTYPDTRLDPNGVTKPPYDITGWTLPLQMSVTVDRIEDELEVDSELVTEPVSFEGGTVSGDGRWGYAVRHDMNASIKLVNELMSDGEAVHWSNEAFRAGRRDYPAGTFLVESGAQTAQRMEALAQATGVDIAGLSSSPTDEVSALRLPRVGLYKSYVAFMDEGWTRWLLENYGFDVVTLHDEDLRRGELSSLDAIVLTHSDGSAYFTDATSKYLTGHPAGTMPEEYTGGMGLDGALAIQSFVKAGGTLLAFGSASDFAIRHMGLPIRNIVAGASREVYSIPGSLISATVDTSHPLGYGMTETASLTVVGGGAFAPVGQKDCVDDYLNQGHCVELRRGGRPLIGFPEPIPHDAVVSYADEDLLLSGWSKGTEYIAGRSAMAAVAHGKGSVVLFGFRPQFRGQPRGTYKLVFNALHAATIE